MRDDFLLLGDLARLEREGDLDFDLFDFDLCFLCDFLGLFGDFELFLVFDLDLRLFFDFDLEFLVADLDLDLFLMGLDFDLERDLRCFDERDDLLVGDLDILYEFE